MADTFDKVKRSEIMSKVHGKNTTPEIIVRRILFGLGYRYRLHRKDLPGKPDIVLPKYKTIINVNGCFWHGCPHCKHAQVRPATNQEYWNKKLDGNIARDRENQYMLEKSGWKVLVVWECETKKKKLELLTAKLQEFLSP